jgi:16S rRNA (cytidine1402-2'-O)-methyltransferase
MRVQKSFQDHGGIGTLYLVATPIGNLEDMTFRALRVLREADWIAAEDTRHTRKLLAHFEITGKPLISYHEHNKQTSGPEIIRLLRSGSSVALVSDAGLPAISDPGADLVKLAIEDNIPVVPVPGANAALSALIMSGMPTDRFTFAGFLPRDKKGLEQALRSLRSVEGTIILYEAPHRLRKTLAALIEAWGDRPAVIVRELTKKHEEAVRGTLRECLGHFTEQEPLGEFCLLVSSPGETKEEAGPWWSLLSIREHVKAYEERGCDRKEAMKRTASDREIPRRTVYQAYLDEERKNGGEEEE